jgi:hypothetical protein
LKIAGRKKKKEKMPIFFAAVDVALIPLSKDFSSELSF